VDDADDLVQDMLERAFSTWLSWRGVGSVRPWLFSMTHNLLVDQCAVAAAWAHFKRWTKAHAFRATGRVRLRLLHPRPAPS
jgi:hypothetical protein